MAKLTENDVLDPFEGKALNDNYNNLTWHNYDGTFVLYNYEWMDDPELRQQFGVTDKLHLDWLYRGIELSISLTIEDAKVIRCYVDKDRSSSCGHFKPNIYPLTPTQQELRVAKRILEYITNDL